MAPVALQSVKGFEVIMQVVAHKAALAQQGSPTHKDVLHLQHLHSSCMMAICKVEVLQILH
jgi:hypothetical protein